MDVDTRDKRTGKFIKGISASPATQFKKGEHWRSHKPIWDKEWLYQEYVIKQRSASDIAEEVGVQHAAVYHWMRKHNIPRRSIHEVRQIKHWGMSGERNGMFGKRGKDNPHWQGGITPDRQEFYTSQEWKDACYFVWKRDGATCQRCNLLQEFTVSKFHIHHIVSFRNKKLRAEVTNLVLLCETCHHFVHSKLNTEKEFIK